MVDSAKTIHLTALDLVRVVAFLSFFLRIVLRIQSHGVDQGKSKPISKQVVGFLSTSQGIGFERLEEAATNDVVHWMIL